MNNCDNRCPTFREIEPLRAKCLACGGKCDKSCGTYRVIEGLRAQCLACRVCKDDNTMQIAGRGVVYMDSAEDPETVIAHGEGVRSHAPEAYREEEGETFLTKLPADAERRLLYLLRCFASLDPMQVLICHHMANGGGLTDFGVKLDELSMRILGYEQFEKRNAWAIWKSVRAKCPELDELFIRHCEAAHRGRRTAARRREEAGSGGKARG